MDRTHKGSWGWGNVVRIEEAGVEVGVTEGTGPRLVKQHGTEW